MWTLNHPFKWSSWAALKHSTTKTHFFVVIISVLFKCSWKQRNFDESDTAVQTHSMTYDWFWLRIPSCMKPLWMEWKFLSILHFTVTTAEFTMLNVLRCLASLHSYESLLNTLVSFVAVPLPSVTSRIFILLILVNSTVILKTLLEVT